MSPPETRLRPLRIRAPLLITLLLSSFPVLAQPSPAGPPSGAAATYQLTEKELGYDCKKLTGTVQVRILQLRSAAGQQRTTEASRIIQQATTPIFGGTAYGTAPDAQRQADLAMVEAYNRRLVEKRCRSFDLRAALSPAAGSATPRPTVPAPAEQAGR